MGETLNSDEGNTSLSFDSSDELDEILEDEDAEPTNTIITQLSDEAKLRMAVLQSLIEPCDRTFSTAIKSDRTSQHHKGDRTSQHHKGDRTFPTSQMRSRNACR